MFWPIRAESSGSRFPFPLGVFKRTSEHRCWARTMPARVETSICRLVPAVSIVIRSARNGSWPDINDRSSCSVACESTPLIRPLTPNQATIVVVSTAALGRLLVFALQVQTTPVRSHAAEILGSNQDGAVDSPHDYGLRRPCRRRTGCA